jgi:Cu2+-containing amine oxidase
MHCTSSSRQVLLLFLILAAVFAFPANSARAQTKEKNREESEDKKPPFLTTDEFQKLHFERIIRGARISRERIPSALTKLPDGVVEISESEVWRTLGGDSPKAPKKVLLPTASSSNASKKVKCFQKSFPQVKWRFCVTDMVNKGLWINSVFLSRGPTDNFWRSVIRQAGLAEIFVPYQHQYDWHTYDLNQYTKPLNQVGAAEAGSTGSLVKLYTETVPTVVMENRDRGIGLLCHERNLSPDPENLPDIVKRSSELLVWGVSDAGNYDNIIQYGFRDDGVITFRLGASGYTNPNAPWDSHAHTGLWRVDVDLNNTKNDTAYRLSHVETSSGVNDSQSLIANEAGIVYNSKEQTTLLVEDQASNQYGNFLGYEFIPVTPGLSRNYRPAGETDWTQNDFYVSKYKTDELGWVAPTNEVVDTIFAGQIIGTGWKHPDIYLTQQILPAEPVINTNIIVWIKSAFHHHPTDEEKTTALVPPGGGSGDHLKTALDVAIPHHGITSNHWQGFDLVPHNFFEANPLEAQNSCRETTP